MMHQQHPEGVVGRQLRKMAIERVELRAAEPASRHQRRRRHRRGHADQRQRSTAAQERKRSALRGGGVAQVIAEVAGETVPGRAHIGVVVAGNDGDVFRRADAFEPDARRGEFRVEGEIDEIAGHGDMVRPLRLHVGDQRIQHVAPVIFVAVTGPVKITERALAGEIAQARRRQRRQMRIRQMRQRVRRHPRSAGWFVS